MRIYRDGEISLKYFFILLDSAECESRRSIKETRGRNARRISFVSPRGMRREELKTANNNNGVHAHGNFVSRGYARALS